MKNLLGDFIFGKNAKVSAFFVVGIFLFVGLGCFGGKSSGSKTVPPAYIGAWTGTDGSTITIRGDGKGDYKSGGTSVDGGTVEVDDAKKELSITFFGIGPTKKIDSPPTGDEMKLDGIVYKRNGGNSTALTDTNSKTTSSPDAKSSPSSSPAKTNYEKADASRGEIPEGDELQEMTQKTLIEFNDAVQADDFTDFFQTISKLWQRQSSPAKLKDTFQIFVDRKIDIGAVRTMEATFTSKPRVDDSKGFKELILEGKYDTSPNPTRFELKYTPEGKNWKLTGIMVDNTR